MAETSGAELIVDALVIGGGPAGLSAALNLGRARATVLLADAGRPRNAATLRSHGFLTRDGVPPIELRKLGIAELAQYPDVQVAERTPVTSLDAATDAPDGIRFLATLAVRGAGAATRVAARSVLVATGLRETLPAIPSIRAYYGMTLFSCAACDGWELRDRPLALIGESADLATRALLISRWTNELTVFTNGAPVIDEAEEVHLASRGIRVDHRVIDDLEGERGTVSAVRLADGGRVPIAGGFVRPTWHPSLEFLTGVAPEVDADGHLVTDASGRTSIAGLYAAGDAASPGPQQLIVAAGAGARVAAVLTHDLLGVTTAH